MSSNTVPVQLYAVFHLNLAFSSIPEEDHKRVIDSCYWPLLNLVERHNIPLGLMRDIYYRLGWGAFTNQKELYFVDFANLARSNLPVGWNDEIGGTFQLLDGRWYNSSRQYWRGNLTYESPFILLKPLNRWLGMIQQERLYAGVLFMPHLNPYIELGYGIGTHIFDVGAFVSTINGRFDTFGFKFTFELFNK
mgnify:CR=1 FL=1